MTQTATQTEPLAGDRARLCAYRIYARSRQASRVSDALHRELSSAGLPSRERRFVTELVLGATRMQGRLDAELLPCYRGRYRHLEHKVRQLLRLGAYQMRFMDAVPAHAAVDSSVNLARAVGLGRATGLVNGVLRKLAGTDPLPEPGPDADSAALAEWHSHPRWIVERWLEQWGRTRTLQLLIWNNRRPTVWLRILGGEPARDRLGELAADAAVSLEGHPVLDEYTAVRPFAGALLTEAVLAEGLFTVQDPSAGAVLRAVNPRPGETIIDLCAGPGGKTAALATAVGSAGRIHAFEADPARLELLKEMLQRLGLGNVSLHPGDARDQQLPAADKILIDVPCSGTGVMARRADLRWRREPEHIAELAQLQGELLAHGAGALQSGAVLIYATCSLEQEENWAGVNSFMAQHPDYNLTPLPAAVPEAWLDAQGALATFPPEHAVDGVFAVGLDRS